MSETLSAAVPSAIPDVDVASHSSSSSQLPVVKKRRVERRERLRKSALCKHFDKPGGCPFPNCKFAHGRAEVNDSDTHSVAAQRRLIRDQAIRRAEEQFQTSDAGAVTSKHRGTMIERYYTEMFSCDTMSKPMEDQYVHMHSNRLCVVGVAESHPIMQEELLSVEFAQNVLESRVSGKKKKGGRFMQPNTMICNLKSKSGREYSLYSCIRGSLIEVNERLLKDPQLIQRKHQSDGYLVIIQPKKVEIAEIQESLLSKDEYKQFRAISNTIERNKHTKVTPDETSADHLCEDEVKNESTHNIVEGPTCDSVKEESMSEGVSMDI
ncbi:protein fam206a-like [Plasmopara halstedii]|uniref:Protein Abitram n=1 Tax=Plasmopara halstedii TaxID=4781 RepID=A0A0P1AV39_PLAHL|nr:protein fam206a-like [Plasmopara halstedii]CEG45047.1 protein fam206a-like [Plasmopara halstedii]|eukprot:XP_024581416.1 protein fam206a-like [Plasmopara halstedii]